MTEQSKVSTTVDTAKAAQSDWWFSSKVPTSPAQAADGVKKDANLTKKKWINRAGLVLGFCIDYGAIALVIWVVVATMHN